MRILIFSIGPIFPHEVHGGSQRVLRDLCLGLAKRGHQVHILCTAREDNNRSFELGSGVTVDPVLPFRQTFPFPYETSPSSLCRILEIIESLEPAFDVLYMHADGFLMKPALKWSKPVVTSLHDFVYSISMLSTFIPGRGPILVPSNYVANCIASSVGVRLPELAGRVHVIENGIDLLRLKATRPDGVLRCVKVDPGDPIILFPHRPDERKGLQIALKVLRDVKAAGHPKIRMLVPNYVDLRVSSELAPFYQDLRDCTRRLGLEDNVIVHDWVPCDLMAEYYSLGRITLCVGNFIESFGLVPVESLACGTPVVVSRVGAQAGVLPEGLPGVTHVDWQDIRAVRDAVLNHLAADDAGETVTSRSYIESNFDIQRMIDTYETVFSKGTLSLGGGEETRGSGYALSPWCRLCRSGLYDDYAYAYIDQPRVVEFLRRLARDRFSLDEWLADGLPEVELTRLVAGGVFLRERSI